MNSSVPKQHLSLRGKPVLVHTVLAFLTMQDISSMVIVIHPEHGNTTKTLILQHLPETLQHKVQFTAGGTLRQDSVRAGLAALPSEIELVLVHDAARPLVNRETIVRAMQGAMLEGAVIAAIPVKDTIKQVNAEHLVQATVDRSHLWQAQTPQAARRPLLEQAFAHAEATGFQGTDEASLLEHCQIPVHVVEGHEHNLKITTPGDMALSEFLLENRSL
ncbi:2-C-methyl-D-erythritol 4-phosphate cytidylyltransferase [Desulfogranum japonicum]|uniref:2-C-methyl-D-erythritol 4-phosphate cytidylyltransferase n=1 Tax=Desulfogranum japonicum TaxID=231447 RepID=UPI000417A159|nr:2-C-methyl-D-erythritol 4-phosphate cytidylyltransferase [Desulfogranum japonicum]